MPRPVIHRLLSARITHSTVLIVTPEQTRSLEVDTRLLTWLKPLLVGLAASTALLTAGLIGLGAQHLISRASRHWMRASKRSTRCGRKWPT